MNELKETMERVIHKTQEDRRAEILKKNYKNKYQNEKFW